MPRPVLARLRARWPTSQQSRNPRDDRTYPLRYQRLGRRASFARRESKECPASTPMRAGRRGTNRFFESQREKQRGPVATRWKSQRVVATLLPRGAASNRRDEFGLSRDPGRNARCARGAGVGSCASRGGSWHLCHPNRGLSGAISTRIGIAESTTRRPRSGSARSSSPLSPSWDLSLSRMDPIMRSHAMKMISFLPGITQRAWPRKAFPTSSVAAKWY